MLESLLTHTASAAWHLVQAGNRLGRGNPRRPRWAPPATHRPAPSDAEGQAPDRPQPFTLPRETTSLCPDCVRDLRGRISRGEVGADALRGHHPGQIPARILERDGRIVIEKACATHGRFEETLSGNPEFTRRIERLFPGRDFDSSGDPLHDHGTSSIRYGRGGVLTIDLTNRCDMMCEPCFMDANQVGYVHELTFAEVRQYIDNALTIRPRRQISIQFSGGEPTLSPIFLDAVAYARQVGYFSVQAATNGIRFAQDEAFARRAFDAGLRIAYLQFDGVGEEANAHRKVPNLFAVKLRAIENLYEAGIDVVLVVTVIGGVNDHQVGRIVKFAVENSDKISFVAFQPVSFTGRDEEIDDERRKRQRYMTSQLVEDVQRQTGVLEPLRDWFPLSAVAVAADLTDSIKGPAAEWGTLKCGCHPDCGVATGLMVNKRTKAWGSAASDAERRAVLRRRGRHCEGGARPVPDEAADRARGAQELQARAGAGGLPAQGPAQEVRQADRRCARRQAWRHRQREPQEGRLAHPVRRRNVVPGSLDVRLPAHGDVPHPYATPIGEIAFCAYNTGIGWRQVVEHSRCNPTVAEWHRQYGRHEVYANPNKKVPIPDAERPAALRVPEDARLQPCGGTVEPAVGKPLAGVASRIWRVTEVK